MSSATKITIYLNSLSQVKVFVSLYFCFDVFVLVLFFFFLE